VLRAWKARLRLQKELEFNWLQANIPAVHRAIYTLAALAAGGASLFSTPPTEVSLKNGASVRGDILRERDDGIVLDLGYTVLTVPRAEITGVKKVDAAPGKPEQGSRAEDIFHIDESRPSLSVEQNVVRVSESVVQIQTATGLGSGFIINSMGHVVTNQHVIAGEQEIRVIVYRKKPTGLDKQTYSNVRIIAMNGFLDLALLQIDDPGVASLPHAVLGDSEEIAQGEHVFAIGSPLGLERTVSQGIVSVRARENSGRWFIQTTTQINPGNSGGPLFNARGEVVGVTNMKTAGVGIEGVGFAIPASLLKLFVKNREAFAFDARNPNHGFRYLPPPAAEVPAPPDQLTKVSPATSPEDSPILKKP
jgi:serine protease Do